MFAAGTETTTTVMEWAVAELVTHPRAMRKLQHEIRGAVGTKLPQVTEDRLGNLTYLRAVVKETLRLHVPLPLLVPRAPPADAEVLGYRVPAGTRVVVNAWAIARDPATWGQDAEEFRPERFFLRSAGVDYRGQSFELLPFGAGRRGCPGVGFAEQSIELGLASLFYHFDWEAEAALDMTEKNGLAVTIKSGLPLRAKPAWVQSVKKS
jgi:cytochrome P450